MQKKAKLNLIFLSGLIYFFSFFPRSLRWKWLIKSNQKIYNKNLFPLLFISYMGNCLFPARMGDIIRAYMLREKEKISLGIGLASVITEKAFDALILLILLEFLFLKYSFFPFWVKKMGIFLLIFLFFFLIFSLVILYFKKKFNLIVKKIFFFLKEDWHKKIENFIFNFTSGLKLIFKIENFILAFFFSLIIWLMEGIVYYLAMLAMGIKLHFFVGVFILILINLSMIIPATPGAWGIFESASVLGLSLFKINKESALSFALILHTLIYILLVALGLLFLWKENLSPKKLIEITKIRE
ncbi:MAG: flippase-like domain-containing protein [Armatimonadetes bacterium]|nr:flippase-like domain-containing protein [Armatimonadota bacterium]